MVGVAWGGAILVVGVVPDCKLAFGVGVVSGTQFGCKVGVVFGGMLGTEMGVVLAGNEVGVVLES